MLITSGCIEYKDGSLSFNFQNLSSPPNITEKLPDPQKLTISKNVTKNIIPDTKIDIEGGWKTIDAEGKFSFDLPQSMNKKEVLPMDSFVQHYVGDGMLVIFDYGWFSDPLDRYESEPEYWREQKKVGGFDATLIGYKPDADWGKYHAGIAFRNITNDGIVPTHFTMSISYNNSEDKNTAIKILESIRFP
jgi:hypothetical protein